MTTPRPSPEAGHQRPAHVAVPGWHVLARGLVHGRRRRWALASLVSFWLAALVLTLPLAVYADANALASYGATASGWAIQPYILNDAFLNVPAADQSAPYVFVSMDNTPGARAKASYFFPGTAANAVPNTQGVPVTVPAGVEARYPGTGSASGQVGLFNDGVATQAAAGTESAQASEGYALAQSGVAHYQFAPTILAAPMPGAPGAPALPSPPAVPTVPGSGPTATATTGSGGGTAPTPTTGAGPTPTPMPTACLLPAPLCLHSASAAPETMALLSAQTAQGQPGLSPAQLPDNVEQQLIAVLKGAETANPTLLALAGGHVPTADSQLPYAGADASSQAATRATDSGVGVTVVTRAQHVELLQGLITFGSVESALQAVAPASKTPGSGTITTQVTGATIAGIPITLDEKGVTVSDQGASADQIRALSDQLNAALTKVGIHVTLASSVTKTDAGFWEGAGAGVEVTAGLDPAGGGLPSPASGVPATHIDFSIGKVSASIYAMSNAQSGSGGSGGGDGGGYCFFCGGSGGGGDIPSGQTPASTKHGGGKSFSLLGGLSGGELLALVFVVQGVSTAAVAATAGYTDTATRAGQAPIEEESH